MAVAQEAAQVICWLEVWWFDPCLLSFACHSIQNCSPIHSSYCESVWLLDRKHLGVRKSVRMSGCEWGMLCKAVNLPRIGCLNKFTPGSDRETAKEALCQALQASVGVLNVSVPDSMIRKQQGNYWLFVRVARSKPLLFWKECGSLAFQNSAESTKKHSW